MEKQGFLNYLTLPASLYYKIENDVTNIFLKLNIREYPIDTMDIALKLGYELVPFSKMNKEAKRILIPKDVDGISLFDPEKKTFIIYYRPDGMKERLRFTIGHEIGHIRMGHKGESELARRIADYYSAYLLAPSPWIGHAGCEDFTDVAEVFGISIPCALRCFERYERWTSFPILKKYEKNLINLVSI